VASTGLFSGGLSHGCVAGSIPEACGWIECRGVWPDRAQKSAAGWSRSDVAGSSSEEDGWLPPGGVWSRMVCCLSVCPVKRVLLASGRRGCGRIERMRVWLESVADGVAAGCGRGGWCFRAKARSANVDFTTGIR